MESAGSPADAASTTAGHPSPQAVLTKTRKLYNAIRTKEAYDEAVGAEITAVVTDICHLIASASDGQLRVRAVRQLMRLLFIKHLDGMVGQKAVNVRVVPVLVGGAAGEREAAGAGSMPAGHASRSSRRNGGQCWCCPAPRVLGGHGGAAQHHSGAVVAAGILEPLLKVMREATNAEVLSWSGRLLCDVWIVAENEPLPAPLAEFAPL
ncbi:unnamed protein product [Vitrella brassicaformis CCMP3155]|uniref:Uncharacterized protein n=1 Tax=Vitrella brassicaformis (strain CCMP3155) TaxID=1169540 RepID=A0A0G4GI05_VITBC|nr:unnamed protein product [Vitrella brassicaformis CCMP3155]|eukprot:CEM29390.1 unnamed protein product [Vitrella brassicaformis CCMP3155]